jgi:hypothetical protein
MSSLRSPALICLCLSLLQAAGCAGPTASSNSPRTEVVVLGMIHGGHKTNALYGIETIQDIVRRVRPDAILCEIPPDRLDTALAQFRQTGEVLEPRVARFPEYVEAIFPLGLELDYEIVPCAAWTEAMAASRSAKLSNWQTSRPEQTREVDDAQALAEQRLHAEGLADDPRSIHSERYDALVKAGMEPYARLFNDDLGPGGWENINAAHYALVAADLDARRGRGQRVLVTFGAWHKYWLREALAQRDDVLLLDVAPFLAPGPRAIDPLAPGPRATGPTDPGDGLD